MENKRVLYNGKIVRKDKKLKSLGKAGEFRFNYYGCSIERTVPQFVLKVENNGLYDKEYKNNITGEAGNEFRYDIYVEAELIKNKDYAYIEYKHDEKFPDNKLTLLEAYKQAVELEKKLLKEITIFLYEGFAFILDERFLSDKRRQFFKSIERTVLMRKYQGGMKKGVKQGAVKAEKMTQAILLRTGQ